MGTSGLSGCSGCVGMGQSPYAQHLTTQKAGVMRFLQEERQREQAKAALTRNVTRVGDLTRSRNIGFVDSPGLRYAFAQAVEEDAAAKKKKKRWLIIGGVAIIGLIAVVATRPAAKKT